jgi:hypothetical protein
MCRLVERVSASFDFLQLLKVILTPFSDFVLLDARAIWALDVQAKLAPAAVEVVRAKKGAILGRI